MSDFICFKDGAGKWLAVNDFGRELYHLKGIDYKGKKPVLKNAIKSASIYKEQRFSDHAPLIIDYQL